MRDGQDVCFTLAPKKATPYEFISLQIPIKAGHEFIITTDDKYSEICDDKVLYVDYVRDFTVSWT